MKRTVDSKFWTSRNVRKLPHQVKYLFQYFMTCPATHMSGIYYLPMPTIIYETGLSEKAILKGIDTLSEGYMVRHDAENNIVWVVNMLKHQGWSKNIRAAVVAQLKSLHESPLIEDFLKHYKTLSIPFRNPSERLLESPDTDTESDTNTVSDSSSSSFNSPPKKPPPPGELLRATPTKKEIRRRAQIQAGKVWDAVGKNGRTSPPTFEDPITRRVVNESYSGWGRLCDGVKSDGRDGFHREFRRAYLAYALEDPHGG